MKGENLEPSSLLERSLKKEHERIRVFYELAIPIIEEYKKYCINKSYVDLIILTVKLLKYNEDIRELYRNKYLMVDEFQDVNGL